MGSEPIGHGGEPGPTGRIERALVSGVEIQRRVQQLIDADPELNKCEKKINAPMPKPATSDSPTGCNWHMHYRGQFPDCEQRIDMIVELAQHEMNIGAPVLGFSN